MKKAFLLLFCLSCSATCGANQASALLARTEPSGLTAMVFSLFILTLVVVGLYWLMRRFLQQRLGLGRRMQGMRIVSVTMLGPKEKIVVVDTREGESLVLGVTAQQITLLDKRPFDSPQT